MIKGAPENRNLNNYNQYNDLSVKHRKQTGSQNKSNLFTESIKIKDSRIISQTYNNQTVFETEKYTEISTYDFSRLVVAFYSTESQLG